MEYIYTVTDTISSLILPFSNKKYLGMSELLYVAQNKTKMKTCHNQTQGYQVVIGGK